MALNRHYDIFIPGHYFCDVIFTGLPAFPSLGTEIYTEGLSIVPGGGALNTAVALQRLGIHTAWVGALGNDFCSRFVRDYLVAEHIDLAQVTQLESPMRRMTVALSYPTDRAFVSYVDDSPGIFEMLEQALETASCRQVHLAGLLIDERLPALLDACHQRGITVSMDCQHREETLALPLVREILSRVDLFMPNISEALRLTGERNLESAVTILLNYVPALVVKDGANGAHLWEKGQTLHMPAVPVEPLDTTGAGDCFNAGFLAARLRGFDALTCLEWGNRCGALSTRGYGGTNAPTLAEVLRE